MGHTRKVNAGLAQIDSTRFVGEYGHLFYDNDTGSLRRSDGRTPGGLPVTVAVTTASIGDLVIQGSTIGTTNANENIVLQSNGTGEISVIGSFMVHTPQGQQILEIADSGEVQFLAPTQDSYNSAFSIVGNSTGTLQNPQTTGVILQTTGQQDLPSRIYNDGVNNYSAYIGRRYNGNASNPTAIQAGQIISRIGATPYTTGGWPSLSTARIDFIASENQTTSTQGTKIVFSTVSSGTNSNPDGVIVVDSTGLYPYSAGAAVSLGSSTNRWSDVWVGPHSLHLQDQTSLQDVAITANNGTLYLNGAQNIQIGQLVIVGNTIQSITPSTQINLGDINDTGLFNIGRSTLIQSPFFASTTSLLTIAGTTATGISLENAGTMIHIIGQVDESSRIINDSYGAGLYPLYAGRSARGTISNPTSTSATDVLSRFGANGYVAGAGTGTGFLTFGSARIDFTASENYTPTSRGTQITFWTTPKGSTTVNNVATFSDTGLVTQAITFSADNSVQSSAGVPANTVGISNGIAQLGGDGKLLASQIPTSLQGAVTFAGGWNANTNTPNLANNTSTYSTGTEFVITQSGTQNLGSGNVAYQAGGFVIYGGGVWNYAPGVSNFTSISAINHISVNTSTGVIQITSDATPNNTTATIVARDSSGNFQAGLITANLMGNVTGNVTGSLTGNAATASKLNSAVSINGASFDGSANIQVNNTSTLTFGTGFNSGSYNGSIPVTITLNTSTLVANAVNAIYAQSFNTNTVVTTAVNATNATTASFATTSGYAQSFNTNTVVTTAVTAGKVAKALTTGFGLQFSAGTTYDGSNALTINQYYNITGPVTVSGNAYTLDFSTATGVMILNDSGNAMSITMANPVPGKVVKLIVLNMVGGAGAKAVTVSNLTAANSSNGTNQFVATSPNTSAAIVELICTTTATSGVYMTVSGAK